MDGTEKGDKTAEAAAPTRTKRVKSTKKATATKEPKREPRRREMLDGEVVVFAFRLGANDRDKIHAASGPAGATRFVRSAAMAAATGDAKTFEALVAQAKANQK